MKKLIITLALLLIASPCYSALVQQYFDYNPGDEVTDINLDGNFTNIINEINGGLDNNNADTDDGFRFIEIVDSLPAVGNEGRVIFDRNTDLFYIDTGTDFLAAVTYSGTASQGDITYFDGANWLLLNKDTTTTRYLANTAGSNNPQWDQIELTDGVSGILPLDNGGTGQDLSSTHQGDIYYDNGTNAFSRLLPGSDGQILRTSGPSTIPGWANPGMQLISTETPSGVDESAGITIEASKSYLCVFEINTLSADAKLEIRFNSLETGIYDFSGQNYIYHDTATQTLYNGDGGSGIKMSDTDLDGDGNDFATGHFFFSTYKVGTAYSAFVHGGNMVAETAATTQREFYQFMGYVDSNITVASIELATDGAETFSGTIQVYELIK